MLRTSWMAKLRSELLRISARVPRLHRISKLRLNMRQNFELSWLRRKLTLIHTLTCLPDFFTLFASQLDYCELVAAFLMRNADKMFQLNLCDLSKHCLHPWLWHKRTFEVILYIPFSFLYDNLVEVLPGICG